MYFLYSLLYTFAMLLMSPLFLLRREKYASGFRERLGNYPVFKIDDRKVIWLHCVSVGETNAARPLVDALIEQIPSHRIVVSTTTKTGHELAKTIFAEKIDAVFYFPFDWKFSVRRALRHFQPSLILLMETEIWPRLIVEAKRSGARVAIVNGRLSGRSFRRYTRVLSFVRTALANVDLALMQSKPDADRIKQLGFDEEKIAVTGNIKFQNPVTAAETGLTDELRDRFGITNDEPLIIAASTHEPEERYVIESLEGILGRDCRLLIAPRHPERFDSVANLLSEYSYSFTRRSSAPAEHDKTADVILLDSIGELRAAYPLADIVFVGGSLIPHGGQSILEPAAEGKAVIIGPFTHNFEAVMSEFLRNNAVRQTPTAPQEFQISERLSEEFSDLLENPKKRLELSANAVSVMDGSNRGATQVTTEHLADLLTKRG
jgi:3-deoxy-D-manno-octulosonic-acid transferase